MFANWAMMCENVSLHPFNSEVGTTSSGDDLDGIDFNSCSISSAGSGGNSSNVPWCDLSDESGAGLQPWSASTIACLIFRTLFTKYSAIAVQLSFCVGLTCECSPCRRSFTADHNDESHL